eukprot:1535473-Prymnesium_polylepis.1
MELMLMSTLSADAASICSSESVCTLSETMFSSFQLRCMAQVPPSADSGRASARTSASTSGCNAALAAVGLARPGPSQSPSGPAARSRASGCRS